eukprot:6239889-Alexandrium_andersonii.AAC.1
MAPLAVSGGEGRVRSGTKVSPPRNDVWEELGQSVPSLVLADGDRGGTPSGPGWRNCRPCLG